jgi:hypothetical protein
MRVIFFLADTRLLIAMVGRIRSVKEVGSHLAAMMTCILQWSDVERTGELNMGRILGK